MNERINSLGKAIKSIETEISQSMKIVLLEEIVLLLKPFNDKQWLENSKLFQSIKWRKHSLLEIRFETYKFLPMYSSIKYNFEL